MAARVVLAAVLLVSLYLVAASAEVVNLTDETFETAVADPSKVFFIKFYTPWCGHCKRLAPTWHELWTEVEDPIVIAHVDCTLAKDTCAKQEIRGYPTLKAFYKGVEYKPYQGARDLPSMKSFIKNVAAETLETTS